MQYNLSVKHGYFQITFLLQIVFNMSHVLYLNYYWH